jgi:hypothetical protein
LNTIIEMDAGSWPCEQESSLSIDHSAGFIAALLSGGDSRIVPDRHTGLNRYLCPTVPASELLCVSSCTASPISVPGFDRATTAFLDIVRAPSQRQQAGRLTTLTEAVEASLLRYFGVGALAQAFLCPSGTDALLATAMLLAAERPNETMTAILPATSETGTGVPMAATGRLFDGPEGGRSLTGCAGKIIEIPLRSADGSPRSEDAVNEAFAAATAAADGNVILYLTHGTKTGLIAPVSPPDGANVIVDACQARIAPETVVAYLRRGWPVVVTGSKFFGGPAFSGAVLFPRARLPATGRSALPEAGKLGTALRWTAALAGLEAFEPLAATMSKTLINRAATVEKAIAANSALVLIKGLEPRGSGWADLPSIFTFGVRGPRDRLRSVVELRPLYNYLAQKGILLGQPVDLGPFGGLRIAFGARDLLNGDSGLVRVFATLRAATDITPAQQLQEIVQ